MRYMGNKLWNLSEDPEKASPLTPLSQSGQLQEEHEGSPPTPGYTKSEPRCFLYFGGRTKTELYIWIGEMALTFTGGDNKSHVAIRPAL